MSEMTDALFDEVMAKGTARAQYITADYAMEQYEKIIKARDKSTSANIRSLIVEIHYTTVRVSTPTMQPLDKVVTAIKQEDEILAELILLRKAVVNLISWSLDFKMFGELPEVRRAIASVTKVPVDKPAQ